MVLFEIYFDGFDALILFRLGLQVNLLDIFN
jgi:hypothetical protein